MSRLRRPGPIQARRPWNPDYGDGSDGSPASSTFTVSKQEYQWVNYTLSNGNTITLSASYKPSIFRAQGTLTLSGAIAGTGLGWTSDLGPGRGTIGVTAGNLAGAGSGAGHGAAGEDGLNTGGSIYSSQLVDLLTQTYGTYWAGSGGGTGGPGTSGGTGGAGGAGGASILFMARRIVIGSTFALTLTGGAGSNGAGGGGPGGGGGGSGGAGVFVGESIEFPSSGTVCTSNGGAGGWDAAVLVQAGDGAVGRFFIVALKAVTPSDAASRCTPAATVVTLRPTIGIG